MKQNERILVYAVSGFLAIILMVAVLFGREGGPGSAGGAGNSAGSNPAVLGVGEVLAGSAGNSGAPNGPPANGLAATGLAALEQPLAAVPKQVIAADLVASKLGASTRDHTVRLVRAVYGDTLESLVRRWCPGPRDTKDYLDEARALNEEMTVLRAGQTVALPWVEDELVLQAYEARQPMAVPTAANPVVPTAGLPVAGAGVGQPATAGEPAAVPSANSQLSSLLAMSPPVTSPPASTATPSSVRPRDASSQPAGAASSVAPAANPTAAGVVSYSVRAGDSLWRIAARAYGKENADRKVAEIRQLNPALGDILKPDQRLLLPVAGMQPGSGLLPPAGRSQP